MDAKDLMNIEIPEVAPTHGLTMITALQRELLFHYVQIEKFPEPVWDMRLKNNQIEAKGFIFRVIEELAEAYESWLKEDEHNFWTELADSTHFLIELGIVTGAEMDLEKYNNIWKAVPQKFEILISGLLLENWFWDITYKLGLVSNAMRNKQWKQTQVLPDMQEFNALMQDAYTTFFMGFVRIGCSEQWMFDWYYRKNQVNQFRIKSKY